MTRPYLCRFLESFDLFDVPSTKDSETKGFIFEIPSKTVVPHRTGIAGSLTHDPTGAPPEHCLPLAFPFSLLITIGLFIDGWSTEYQRY